jgi:hypothetical protein
MSAGNGFLAIWSDVDSKEETDYLHWLTREHTLERLSIPGFMGVRVFRARLPQVCRYFIFYRLEEPGVISSHPYLARLNAPTEWSRRIMPKLRNFIRGGGRVVAEVGCGKGALVLPIICEQPEVATARQAVADLAALDRIASVGFFEAERSGTEIATKEKAMRADDRSFQSLLLVEALSENALGQAFETMRKTIQLAARPVFYEQVFALDRDELAKGRDEIA